MNPPEAPAAAREPSLQRDIDWWSVSLGRTFQTCERRFFYHYLLAHAGKKPGASERARLAAVLQGLVGLEAWAGSLVHEVIAEALMHWRHDRPYGIEIARSRARRMMQSQFRISQEYWRQPDAYKSRPTLIDIHYYEPHVKLDPATSDHLRGVVGGSLDTFFGSELPPRIRAVGAREWLPIDRNASMVFEQEMRILVRPDFAFREGGRLLVLDWKTGKEDPLWELVQVTCYALYAEAQWRAPLDTVSAYTVHLRPAFKLADAGYSDENTLEVRELIRKSYARIRAATPEGREPLEEEFTLTDNIRQCRRCAFRGICEGSSRQAHPGEEGDELGTIAT